MIYGMHLTYKVEVITYEVFAEGGLESQEEFVLERKLSSAVRLFLKINHAHSLTLERGHCAVVGIALTGPGDQGMTPGEKI